jgi:poly(3-hydroxybutyrate) depolymerase
VTGTGWDGAVSLRALAAVLAGLAVVIAGCRATTAAAGTSPASLQVGGVTRTYLLRVPPDLDGPAPLVVVLHGGFGSGAQAERSYGWDALADTRRVVVAYPDGLDRAWNTGGGCCGRPAADGTDDVGFLTALVAAVGRQVAVDPARVYAVTTAVATCADGRAVELVTVDGGGHSWPGAAPRPAVEKALGLDPPAPAPDATALIWEFFAAHPRT